jgi:serine/threonine-protein kinase
MESVQTHVLQVGDKLGRYDIVAPLGAGGEVYKAKDSRLSRMVAIKVLNSRFSSRFEQEARAIAAFSHAHICSLYDVGPDYLVMEYIEGRRLQGKYQPEEALRLAIQMAEALEEAHCKGIVHLDLKPANIMVTATGSIKLLDFGLARLTRPTDTDFTQSMEATAGTVGYMSPEQARGEPVDGRSDIFSFGAVLYEMLAGRPAFEGDSAAVALSALLTKRPAPIQAPPVLERVVMRCLNKDPAGSTDRASGIHYGAGRAPAVHCCIGVCRHERQPGQ